MKPWQWAIIGVEALLLLGVLGGAAWLLLINGPASQQAAQIATPIPAGPTSTPSHTPTPFAWPTPLPSSTPAPANTRVVSREALNQETIGKIEQQVIALRALRPRVQVPVEFLTRSEMLDYARREYQADAKIVQELALYCALGLIQPGIQIDPDTRVKMIASNIAGFYDPENKRLHVISDVENLGADEKVTLAHEYTHALQDQQFDLTQYQARAQTTDAYLATMAVPEGDATVVMSLYLYGNTAASDWDYLAYRAAFADRSVITATGVSTRTGQIAYFPYIQGAQFVAALWLDGKGWAEVNHAYSDPPKSTSQVLHPSRYFTSLATPIPIPLPDLGPTLGKGWSPAIKNDTLGEFVTSVHLDEFLHDPPSALRAAEGWAGDTFALWQAPGEQPTGSLGLQAFAWQIAWDTPRDASEFLTAYADLLNARVGKNRTMERQDANLRWYSGSAGSGLVRLTNDRTLVLWGPDKATVERLLAAIK
jgi:hypothetical protein